MNVKELSVQCMGKVQEEKQVQKE